jgi:hypothetical protein
MGIEINLSADDIDTLVKDSIMKAGFGKAIEEGVKRAMAPGYDNPVEKAMKAYVVEVCDSLLRHRFADQIRTVVAAEIEKQVTNEVIEKVTNAAVQKMVSAASDRY